MKTIDRLKNLMSVDSKPEVILVNYTHAATGHKIRRKGYALIASQPSGLNRLEYLTIEPVSYSNGDKWNFRGPLTHLVFGFNSVHYAKNISQVIKKLKGK